MPGRTKPLRPHRRTPHQIDLFRGPQAGGMPGWSRLPTQTHAALIGSIPCGPRGRRSQFGAARWGGADCVRRRDASGDTGYEGSRRGRRHRRSLVAGVAGTGSPRAVAELNSTDFCEPETTPFALGRQARSALAAELIGEDLLLLLRMAENDRTDLARIAVVHAGDRLAGAHGLFEQTVVGTWHWRSLR